MAEDVVLHLHRIARGEELHQADLMVDHQEDAIVGGQFTFGKSHRKSPVGVG